MHRRMLGHAWAHAWACARAYPRACIWAQQHAILDCYCRRKHEDLQKGAVSPLRAIGPRSGPHLETPFLHGEASYDWRRSGWRPSCCTPAEPALQNCALQPQPQLAPGSQRLKIALCTTRPHVPRVVPPRKAA
eukprot:358436-Chlamydomonas_euryale.AAC.4